MKTFDDFIKIIKDLSNLNIDDSENAFDSILSQNIEENKIIDFLTSLSKKGESVNEIFGAIKSIKKKAKIINGFKNSFDTCGTGGDGSKEFLKPLIIFAFFFILLIAPNISFTLSPFFDNEVKKSIILFSSIFCDKILSKAFSESSIFKLDKSFIIFIKSSKVFIYLLDSSKKFFIKSWPC
jgi:hypothetical protein